MKTALAAVFRGPGQPLSLERFELPKLGPGEAIVRVLATTICGSDVHSHAGRRPVPVPTILGHEIVGELLAFKGECRDLLSGEPLAVGDRVTWSLVASCGECFFCRGDLPQKCVRAFKYGHAPATGASPLGGGLAQVCHLRSGTSIARVPESLADAIAAPASCATATILAAFRDAGTLDGRVILVQGLGHLGLTACAFAASRGARVLAIDPSPSRREIAVNFGAERTFLPTDSIDEPVAEATQGRGVDLAIELSGQLAALESGLPRVRTGGRYVLVGSVLPTAPWTLAPEDIVRRQLTIQGVHNYRPGDLAAGLEFLAASRSRYPWDALVGETFSLAEAEACLLAAKSQRASRLVVRPNG